MNSEARLTEGTSASAPVRRRQPSKQPRAAAANRSSRSHGDEEDSREAMDAREDQELLDERFAAFLDSVDESALPDLPRFAGFHVCWISTMNPHDRPERRQRMGYEFIMVDDCPGWKDIDGPKAGEYAGVVKVNEMVAMKVDERLYQRMMQHWHHDEPISGEEKLKVQVDALRNKAEEQGASVFDEEDSMANIVQRGQGRPSHFA